MVQVSASGQFQIRYQQQLVPCEAGGITIRYYLGQPMGTLMMGVLPPDGQTNGLTQPIPVGLGAEVTAPTSGSICLRINDSPVKMHNNEGELVVQIQKK